MCSTDVPSVCYINCILYHKWIFGVSSDIVLLLNAGIWIFVLSVVCVTLYCFNLTLWERNHTKSNDIASAAAKLEKRLASWPFNNDLNFKTYIFRMTTHVTGWLAMARRWSCAMKDLALAEWNSQVCNECSENFEESIVYFIARKLIIMWL